MKRLASAARDEAQRSGGPSSSGWKAADIEPNEGGVYRCETETVNLKGEYPQPTTLADVNMRLDQLT